MTKQSLKRNSIYLFIAANLLGGSVLAQDIEVDLDEVTMEIVEEQRSERAEARRMNMPYREIVLDYMKDRGDISDEEITAMKEAFETRREAIREARESGDTETLSALREEMMTARNERRESMREYVDANQELKESLEAARDELREQLEASRGTRGERPEVDKERPEIDGERPNVDKERPEWDGERPEADTDRERPEFDGERPEWDGERPEVDEDRPEWDGERPDLEDERPRFDGIRGRR